VATVIGLSGILYLDDMGASSSLCWTFNIHAALTIVANSKVIFMQEKVGLLRNVNWVINGAIPFPLHSIVIGTIVANGAIPLGTGTESGHVSATTPRAVIMQFNFTLSHTLNHPIGHTLDCTSAICCTLNFAINNDNVINQPIGCTLGHALNCSVGFKCRAQQCQA
jgi:hypothetical protein